MHNITYTWFNTDKYINFLKRRGFNDEQIDFLIDQRNSFENQKRNVESIMYVDGRYSANRIKDEVRKRNERFAKNFPHKLADAFCIYVNGVGSVRTHPIRL